MYKTKFKLAACAFQNKRKNCSRQNKREEVEATTQSDCASSRKGFRPNGRKRATISNEYECHMFKMTKFAIKMHHHIDRHQYHRKSISQYCRFVAVIFTLIGLLHGVRCEIGNWFNLIEYTKYIPTNYYFIVV